MTGDIYYKHSGKINLLLLPLTLLLIGISVPILSIVYIYLIYYIPFIYLNFLITGIISVFFGFCVGSAAQIGHIRNTFFATALVLLACILLKYVEWCIYVPIVLAESESYTFLERLIVSAFFFLHPSELFEYIKEINVFGIWSFLGFTPTGVILWIVWAVEFAIIILAGWFGFLGTYISLYCEDEKKWLKKIEGVREFEQINIEDYRADLERGNFDKLLLISETPPADTSNFTRIDIYEPPEKSQYFMTIIQVRFGVNGKGKEVTNITDLLRYIAVEKYTAEKLMREPVAKPARFNYAEVADFNDDANDESTD